MNKQFGVVIYIVAFLCFVGEGSMLYSQDTDGDGLTDIMDRDDDNDGILDIDERSCTAPVHAITATTSSPSQNYGDFSATYTSDGDDLPAVLVNFQGIPIVWNLLQGNDMLTVEYSVPLYNLTIFVRDIDQNETTRVRFYDSNNSLIEDATSFITFQGSQLTVAQPVPVGLSQEISSTSAAHDDDAQGAIVWDFGDQAISRFEVDNFNGSNNGEMVGVLNACADVDMDNDGIPNALDLDSDGDGCPDAIEGDSTYTAADLVTDTNINGGNTGTGYTGIVTLGVQDNLGNNVNSDGVPNEDSQGVGESQNMSYNTVCCTDATTFTFIPDNDGDGIGDDCDLDDDNDGILDDVEDILRTTYTFTGSDQVITAPVNAVGMSVLIWGAGGGSEFVVPPIPVPAGAGGYTYAEFDHTVVNPGTQFVLVVGQGGDRVPGGAGGTYGFGGSSSHDQGGGLSGIFTGSAAVTAIDQGRALAIAGGGGGADYNGPTAGEIYQGFAAGTNGNGVNSGGVSGTMKGSDVAPLRGCEPSLPGMPESWASAGGGGYEGGGRHDWITQTAANTPNCSDDVAGGKGGSGFVSPVATRGLITYTPDGTNTPPNTSDPEYIAGVGVAGTPSNTKGGDGLIVVYWWLDEDGDQLANSLDLDSDGDGCPDAIEGDGTYTARDLVTDTNIDGGSTSVQDNLGITVNADGVPTSGRQGVGESQNTNNNASCCTEAGTFTFIPDNDGDGIGDDCDLDDDNDGILDDVEGFSLDTVALRADDSLFTVCGESNSVTATSSGGQITASGDTWSFQETTVSVGTEYTFTFNRVFTGSIGLFFDSVLEGGAWGNFTITYGDGTIDSGLDFSISPTLNPFGYTIIGSTDTIAPVASIPPGIEDGNQSNGQTPEGQAAGTIFIQGIDPSKEIKSISFEALQVNPTATVFVTRVAPIIFSTCSQDTDMDGIADHLDLDSDGDGCPDAIEGDGTYTARDLVTDTNIDGGSTSVQDNLGITVNADGVPTSGRQGVGESQNTNNNASCCTEAGTFTFIPDNDGDGIGDDCDLDDDNDGVPDQVECPNTETMRTPFSVADGVTETFNFPAADGGFTFDITRLDNSFNLEINGVLLVPDQLQFDPPFIQAGESLVSFSSGGDYGDGTIPSVWNITGTVANPVIRLDIDAFGNVTLQGKKSSTGSLEPLFISNGPGFNSINWNTSGTNTVVVSQKVVGETFLMGEGAGIVRCDTDTDGDGIENRLDLDSDNDGCPDAFEAGVQPANNLVSGVDMGNNNTALDNAVFDTNVEVGMNGLADEIETTPDGGEVAYQHTYPDALAPNVNNCPACDLTNTGLQNVLCNDNNTPADPSDDYITFELRPTGTILSGGYTVMVSGATAITPMNGNYGALTSFRLADGSADGASSYTITITDDADNTCTLTALVGPLMSCSPVTCMITCPADVTISCDADTSAVVNGMAMPVGGTNITDIWHRDLWLEGECEDQITRRWYGRGICDEIDSCDQLITIRDMEAPVFVNENTTFRSSCTYTMPSYEVTDNCGIKRIDTLIEEQSRQCPNTFTDRITFTAYDSCDLTAQLIYTMEVSDNEAPMLSAGQWDTLITDSNTCTVPAFSNTEAIRQVTGREVTDNCSGSVTVNVREELLPDEDCGPRTVRRYYTFRDVCNNTSEEYIQNLIFDQPCRSLESAGEISINGNTRQYLSTGCFGSNVSEVTSATGVCGYLEYMWLVSTEERAPGVPFIPSQANMGIIWNELPNEFGPTLTPGVINQNTYYVRCVRNFTCCDFQESNIVAYLIDEDNGCPQSITGDNADCARNIILMRPDTLDQNQYKTNHSIESNIMIDGVKSINFDAAQGVNLYPDFEVQRQATLNVQTKGCD